jgi:hypothetical protein
MDRSEEIVDNPDGWVGQHIREYVTTITGRVDARCRS